MASLGHTSYITAGSPAAAKEQIQQARQQQAGQQQEDTVQVFSLQPDIWAAPRDDVYIRFNMSQQQVAESVTQLTLCSRVYLTALTSLQVLLSYATADIFSNAIMMCESCQELGGGSRGTEGELILSGLKFTRKS